MMGGRNFFEEGGTYEPFIQNHGKSKGRDGLGSTLDTRHSDTNLTLALRDARMHIETRADAGRRCIEIKLTTQLFLEEIIKWML